MTQAAPHDDDDPFSYAVSERDRSTVSMVRDALDAGRVGLAFQKIVNTADGTTAFHEGLVRLQDETGRTIPAGQFMGVVEDPGAGPPDRRRGAAGRAEHAGGPPRPQACDQHVGPLHRLSALDADAQTRPGP